MNHEEIAGAGDPSAHLSSLKAIRSDLEIIAEGLEVALREMLRGYKRTDKISSRVKSDSSFFDKASIRLPNGSLKYPNPFIEMQDIIGARVVVYYLDDLQPVEELIMEEFRPIETRRLVPEQPDQFGYEGRHYILQIPGDLRNQYLQNPDVPRFFELQVKTLFQHAWAQSEHGLGYKPDSNISDDDKKKLSFVAAQSWGADQILSELFGKRSISTRN